MAHKDTKAAQISDALEYRHHYLTQPTLTPEDCVLHRLQTLTYALEDARKKLRAISTLQELFGKWTKNVPTYPQQQKNLPGHRKKRHLKNKNKTNNTNRE